MQSFAVSTDTWLLFRVLLCLPAAAESADGQWGSWARRGGIETRGGFRLAGCRTRAINHSTTPPDSTGAVRPRSSLSFHAPGFKKASQGWNPQIDALLSAAAI